MNSTVTSNRDPVCGMSVNPNTATYRCEHDGVTQHFCAQNCLEQFKADPEKFVPHEKTVNQSRPRPAIGREVLIAIAIFVGAAALLIMIRGIAKNDTGQTVRASVAGSSAGRHEAVDDGAGGVIVSAKHTQDGEFIVSLNTHTVDLTSFNPASQVRLREGERELVPQTAVVDGETSSHHQNYRVTFADPDQSSVTLSIENVAGVGERQLPFSL